MFKWLGQRNIKIGVTAFLVLIACVIAVFLFYNLGNIVSLLGAFVGIFSPLIVGLVMAYILNPIVKLFEEKIFKKIKKETTRRDLSIAATIILFVALLGAIIGYLIPQLLESILSLITNAPKYLDQTVEFLSKWINNPDVDYSKATEYLLKILNENVLPNVTSMLNSLGNGLLGFLKAIFNFVIGLVFAVYILSNTKNMSKGSKKILYAFFNDKKVDKFIKKVKHINDIFLNFMMGKLADSFCFVFVCTLIFTIIFGYPYPLLIAFIIATTDLIPYFGPYLGTIPSALLILLVDPVKALIFVVFIVVLQQIDANLVTPRIQSKATGLPSFWVLFAITVFGGLFKIVGLLIAVPCFTVIYELVVDYIEEKTEAKKADENTEKTIEE
jgi:predicted PurR-regulated permease PerM